MKLFECDDVDALLAKVEALGVTPHVSIGPNDSRVVFLSDYQLPPESAWRVDGC